MVFAVGWESIMTLRILLLLFSSILASSAEAQAALWRVPSQCPTVQAGIDSAVAGDTVLVACGEYLEWGIEMKSGICLRSETGEAFCVTINAQKQGRVLHCEDLDGTTRIEGITFTGGAVAGDSYPWNAGAGVLCVGSSVVFQDCAFVENAAGGGGGALRMAVSSPILTGCVFSDNVAWNGGAIYCSASSPEFRRCSLTDNFAGIHGGGVYCSASSSPDFEDCVLSRNSATVGGGMYGQGSSSTLTGCVFSWNSADDGGGMQLRDATANLSGCTFLLNSADYGGGLYCYDDSSPVLMNCTFFGNSGKMGGGGMICMYGSSPELGNTIIAFSLAGEALATYQSDPLLSCCDLYANQGGDWVGDIAGQLGTNGNISLDPMFCDPAKNDLHLRGKSSCAPWTPPNPECDLIGAWPVGCGTTAVSAPDKSPASWSSVKSLFR
ncbi:MAG: right-handed parallel beta-helix repeat-containing protein [Candidatus Eisenbacteria sp.]|nr:right-handed parallel beta-helix repeat-containing protein [Candidatus Eisenbacteria bacterium]